MISISGGDPIVMGSTRSCSNKGHKHKAKRHNAAYQYKLNLWKPPSPKKRVTTRMPIPPEKYQAMKKRAYKAIVHHNGSQAGSWGSSASLTQMEVSDARKEKDDLAAAKQRSSMEKRSIEALLANANAVVPERKLLLEQKVADLGMEKVREIASLVLYTKKNGTVCCCLCKSRESSANDAVSNAAHLSSERHCKQFLRYRLHKKILGESTGVRNLDGSSGCPLPTKASVEKY